MTYTHYRSGKKIPRHKRKSYARFMAKLQSSRSSCSMADGYASWCDEHAFNHDFEADLSGLQALERAGILPSPQLTPEAYGAQLTVDMAQNSWQMFDHHELAKISSIRPSFPEWVELLPKVAKLLPSNVKVEKGGRCRAVDDRPIKPGLYRDLYKNTYHRICYLK